MKVKSVFVCQSCGAQSPKWQGKCTNCGSWNSYVEENYFPEAKNSRQELLSRDNPVLLSEIEAKEESRIKTSIAELDRVLGGGIVPGSVILIGGDPGIGKSTISLQVSCFLSQAGYKVLYISGEESVRQTKLRANRLETKGKDNLYIVNQIDLNLILEYIKKLSPDVVIIDSIQVIYQPE
ncbi:MAG: DNA repair protein RadA, partial [Candidatus Omnitrophica bacterium]|nr:DNA repair protein RadA [Candidatus Omnitrophota bacterium]